jgi:hypothetical protein
LPDVRQRVGELVEFPDVSLTVVLVEIPVEEQAEPVGELDVFLVARLAAILVEFPDVSLTVVLVEIPVEEQAEPVGELDVFLDALPDAPPVEIPDGN